MGNDVTAVNRFIKQHKMHKSVPVSLQPVFSLYRVKYLPLSNSLDGFSLGDTIGVNEGLHPFIQRMVLAHETTHRILQHPNSYYLCNSHDWWYRHLELEAQKGAALILVPLKPVITLACQRYSLREMENHFEVPAELVQLRLRLAGLTG